MSHTDLEADVSRIKDYIAISNLQGRYNHYLLTGQWKEIIDLFARDMPGVKIEMADSGIYEGFEGVVKLFQILGTKYHFPGGLGCHLLMTPIVEVAKDGMTAKGMWHSFGTNTILDDDGTLGAMWQLGKYDNTFVRENGTWKYLEFRWYVVFRTPYAEGWVETPIVSGLAQPDGPPVGPLYTPFDPAIDNVFLPYPPEPVD